MHVAYNDFTNFILLKAEVMSPTSSITKQNFLNPCQLTLVD